MRFILQKRGAGREAAANKYGLCSQWSCEHNFESMCQLFPDTKVTFSPECKFYEVKK